jgi:hypothetical protein
LASAGDASSLPVMSFRRPHRPTCLPEGFNQKHNVPRHQTHRVARDLVSKSERPQRSPCGGEDDGCGILGGDGGGIINGGGGGDDDTRPAAKLARLAATPAVVAPPAPAYCTKCSRSERQHEWLFCEGRLCRKALHGSCLSPALNVA